MKKKKELRKEYSFIHDNLKYLLDDLATYGITDYSKVTFEMSYDDCFYEGDDPTVKVAAL